MAYFLSKVGLKFDHMTAEIAMDFGFSIEQISVYRSKSIVLACHSYHASYKCNIDVNAVLNQTALFLYNILLLLL